mmetsp:Transcript_4058/g.10222  ORF Transcript_4058/g.10222 Transcript_4058/m.10222 type:complete len:373 (-) Transcript_4058:87-1205(-)
MAALLAGWATISVALGAPVNPELGPHGAASASAVQFVTLSIDDALHETNALLTEQIPNVSWTFFVCVMMQQSGWSYNDALLHTDCVTANGQDTNAHGCLSKAEMVRRKFQGGHEMALHTYTHLAVASGQNIPYDYIEMEIERNVAYLEACGVNRSTITGFRAPFLDTASWGPGQAQAAKNEALRHLQAAFNKYGILYDSTFTMRPDASMPRRGVRHCSTTEGGWGYHACGFDEQDQYAWAEQLGGYPSYNGATDPSPTWHLFMNTFEWQGSGLGTMDQVNMWCLQNGGECTADEVRSIYMSNFYRHYRGARSPFGIHIHGRSLMTDGEVDGLNAFLDTVRVLPNVRIATMGEVARYYREEAQASTAPKASEQ